MSEKKLSLTEFYNNVERINRTCSTAIENTTAIFLPFRRIDKSLIYKRFIENNQVLEIVNNQDYRVEVRGRLVGQIHKDLLEVLLTCPKIFSKKTKQFKVKTTAYQITKKLKKNRGNKKLIIQRLKEIAEAKINIYFTNRKGEKIDFLFGLIDNVEGIDNEKLTITFSREYTYFLANTELVDYSKYVEDIIGLDTFCRNLKKKLNLKHGINSDFLKAVVRYMLTHKGDNSQIRISNFLKKLNYKDLASTEQVKDCITDLQREEVKKYFEDNFGIELKFDNKTITFNTSKVKKHHFIG